MALVLQTTGTMALPAAALADAVAGPLMLLDATLTITAWNRHCEAICGFTAAEVTGRPFYAVFPQAAANPGIVSALQQALRGFNSFLPDEEGSYTGGNFDNYFSPLRDEQGVVVGLLHQRHDISHRIKAANALMQTNAALTSKNTALREMTVAFEQLCAATRQELYIPMRRVASFINLLLAEEDRLTENGRRYFERIRTQVSKMDGLLNGLLDYISLDTDNSQAEAIEPAMLLRMVQSSLHKEMKDSGAALQWSNLPQLTGRRVLLYQVFEELVRNALKFCPAGVAPSISVTGSIVHLDPLTVDERPQGLCYTGFVISDNGAGFGADEAAGIFRLFYRGRAATDVPGHGLGLALCRKIIELHGGYIQAMPKEGGGCTITFSIPCVDVGPDRPG